ncbi:Glutathione S-transferase DHAR3, chloroplastic [Porphyridium purpureum]|uniref:Glutathione S-transferase DHAR3, chloroplastic n=1 Tax=Porphyridium purpureum TaxID=35688 RepID=A0A5J4YGF4_PORPP|nr:Glutathione S-transferase DHAR3, chloroplastic [Porphyridium purpureum]KAA8492879.1 Glutathione S-transferase DHAR3, chloroplastic [Porphyridium purpureum]|eukprot:POR8297..scf222_8
MADWDTLAGKVPGKPGIDALQTGPDLVVNRSFDGQLRLFDGAQEKDVRVTLYRDPAAWCAYCQRVQMQLEIKRIPYRIRMINMRCYGAKPEYYLRMVPSGLFPAITVSEAGSERNERLITESLDIMFFLEANFPTYASLLPQDTKGKQAMQALLRLERDVFSCWCGHMFYPGGNEKQFVAALQAWSDALDNIAPGKQYMMGDDVSLVDIVAAPFFERYTATAAYWKDMLIRQRFPSIDAWLCALERNVQSFRALQGDIYSHAKAIPPQYGSGYFSKARGSQDALHSVIDGSGANAWLLPLPPLRDEPDWWQSSAFRPSEDLNDPKQAELELQRNKLQAAARLVQNHEKLVKFCVRGIGERPRTVRAPLSDPDADVSRVPSMLKEYVDAALFDLAAWLVAQDDTPGPSVRDSLLQADRDTKQDICASLMYFRDRVGVPRDLPYPAARVLRAGLHFVCQEIAGREEWARLKSQVTSSV